MEYTIILESMEFRAYHGCYEMEQRVGNRFSVDVEITTELGDVASSDDVTRAVNYLVVYELVEEQMQITSCTIEAVAVRIIGAIKGRFAEVSRVKCSVAKIAPPLGGKISRVRVVIEQ